MKVSSHPQAWNKKGYIILATKVVSPSFIISVFWGEKHMIIFFNLPFLFFVNILQDTDVWDPAQLEAGSQDRMIPWQPQQVSTNQSHGLIQVSSKSFCKDYLCPILK